MDARRAATVDGDLRRLPSQVKAELVNGEIVRMSPSGGLPGYAAGRILVRLSDHARRIERGHALPTNVAARGVMLSSVQVRTGASGCAGVRRAVAPTTG